MMSKTRFALAIATGMALGGVLVLFINMMVEIIRFWLGV